MNPLNGVSASDRGILNRIAPFTMTSLERQLALIEGVRYLVRRQVSGCIVECGVWRGGSIMAAILQLQAEGDENRHIYLYDTFAGMPPPSEVDKTFDDTLASTLLERDADGTGYWCESHLDEVQRNVSSTGYPAANLHFVEGVVEETLPEFAPDDAIALLRLDTDWYSSTKHELTHLFPRLISGGLLIIDDYGHWQGAKRAVDEFFAELTEVYYLHRIDYTGRLLIKL